MDDDDNMAFQTGGKNPSEASQKLNVFMAGLSNSDRNRINASIGSAKNCPKIIEVLNRSENSNVRANHKSNYDALVKACKNKDKDTNESIKTVEVVKLQGMARAWVMADEMFWGVKKLTNSKNEREYARVVMAVERFNTDDSTTEIIKSVEGILQVFSKHVLYSWLVSTYNIVEKYIFKPVIEISKFLNRNNNNVYKFRRNLAGVYAYLDKNNRGDHQAVATIRGHVSKMIDAIRKNKDLDKTLPLMAYRQDVRKAPKLLRASAMQFEALVNQEKMKNQKKLVEIEHLYHDHNIVGAETKRMFDLMSRARDFFANKHFLNDQLASGLRFIHVSDLLADPSVANDASAVIMYNKDFDSKDTETMNKIEAILDLMDVISSAQRRPVHEGFTDDEVAEFLDSLNIAGTSTTLNDDDGLDTCFRVERV